MTPQEGCQPQKWLCVHVFVIKNTFTESFGCNILFILNIFSVPVVLLQVNVCAVNN